MGGSTSSVVCYSRYEACGLGWYAPMGRNSSAGECQLCPEGSTSYNLGASWCTCLNSTQVGPGRGLEGMVQGRDVGD